MAGKFTVGTLKCTGDNDTSGTRQGTTCFLVFSYPSVFATNQAMYCGEVINSDWIMPRAGSIISFSVLSDTTIIGGHGTPPEAQIRVNGAEVLDVALSTSVGTKLEAYVNQARGTDTFSALDGIRIYVANAQGVTFDNFIIIVEVVLDG